MEGKSRRMSGKSRRDYIRSIVNGPFLLTARTSAEVVAELRQKFGTGRLIQTKDIQPLMRWFMGDRGEVRATQKGNKKAWILVGAIKPQLGGSLHRKTALPGVLQTTLRKSGFEVEVKDLNHNYGTSGTCTAFLLRKILEKLIYTVMARHGLSPLIEDEKQPRGLLGLDAMVKVASRQKVQGVHCLMPKTAQKIQGIKFLGDTAAHNPLTNVKMESITPQLPFIITAYEELIAKL